MITKITEALNKRNLSGWMVRETRVKSHQSFLALAERECTRRVDTTTYTITIHQKRGDVLGLSSFRLSKEGLPSFEKSLDDALFAAGLVSNQPFELPDAPKYLPEVEIFDATVNENSLTKFEDRLKAAVAKEKSTRLSAAEFFVDAVESRLVNHKGLDVNQRETRLHTEFILLSKAGKTEKEFIDRYSRRYIRDFDLEAQVRDSAQRAREATKASLPQTGAFPVILTDEPLDHIFNPVLARASARLKYNKMIQSEIGQSVTPGGDPKGDTVTLWSNSLLNRALGSSRYDSYGTPGRRICLIEKKQRETFSGGSTLRPLLKSSDHRRTRQPGSGRRLGGVSGSFKPRGDERSGHLSVDGVLGV
jgi:predicted Zn-dependent protease